MEYRNYRNKAWRIKKRMCDLKKGIRSSEGDSNDDILYDKSADTILGRRLNNMSRGGAIEKSSAISVGKSGADNILKRREKLFKKLDKKLNRGMRSPGERLQRESVLYEMAALLGPDIEIEDEKKILKKIKLLKLMSGSKFEIEVKELLTRINAIRRSNRMEPIDRTELLSKSMKQDINREVREKKKREKIKEKKDYLNVKEKERMILGKYVPVKMIDTQDVFTSGLDLEFRGYHYGKLFKIIVEKKTTGMSYGIDTGGHGKVIMINKGNIIGEVRFPGGDRYKYGTKIVIKKNKDEITLVVKRL